MNTNGAQIQCSMTRMRVHVMLELEDFDLLVPDDYFNDPDTVVLNEMGDDIEGLDNSDEGSCFDPADYIDIPLGSPFYNRPVLIGGEQKQ